MKLSVIIPNYHSPVIDRTLASLHNQTLGYGNYQVIVVGQDKHQIIIQDDLVKFDQTERRFAPAEARNRGARQADGEILVFLDADCIAPPDWLETIEKTFLDETVQVLGGGVRFQTDNYWILAENISMFHEYLASNHHFDKTILPSLNFSIRRDVFWQVNGFDERYPYPAPEDADISFRLRQAGYHLSFQPDAAILHVPVRSSLNLFWRRSFLQGRYSIKVHPAYRSTELVGSLLFSHPGIILLFSPLISLVIAFKIFMVDMQLLKYWYAFPAIILSKIGWCLGASKAVSGIDYWQEEV